jgi:hypothetical protein
VLNYLAVSDPQRCPRSFSRRKIAPGEVTGIPNCRVIIQPGFLFRNRARRAAQVVFHSAAVKENRDPADDQNAMPT